VFTYLFAVCVAGEWPCSFPKVSTGNLYRTEKECHQALVATQAGNAGRVKYFGKGSAAFNLYSPCMPLDDALELVTEQHDKQQ